MRKLASAAVGIFLLASAAQAAAPSPEAKLAKALEGRVAGEPVDCINLRDIRSSQVIEDTAIVYDTGRIVYVNRPTAGKESLNDHDALVTRTTSSQLCSIDVVHLQDLSTGFGAGVVFLGEFVPYERVDVRR